MKRSYAQQEFDFEEGGVSTSQTLQSLSHSETHGATELNLSSLNVSADLYAATSRQAGRMNAASVSDSELNELLRERQVLLDKEFSGDISRSEEIRLEYINWSLDRIEDARFGYGLDQLEDWVSKYEQFQRDLEKFQNQLARQKRGSRK